jgi:hypothetical protein
MSISMPSHPYFKSSKGAVISHVSSVREFWQVIVTPRLKFSVGDVEEEAVGEKKGFLVGKIQISSERENAVASLFRILLLSNDSAM